MKNLKKYLRLAIIYTIIIQCIAGFTVFKTIRNHHLHKYVHSANCQEKNALFLGCFDDCNGHQNDSEEQQKKDRAPVDQQFSVEFNAILADEIFIIPSIINEIPFTIYRDVNWITRNPQSVFQPPKASLI